LTLCLGGCTLAGKMEKEGKTTLDQLVSQKREEAVNAQKVSEQTSLDEKKRKAQISADYNRLILPLKKELVSKVPVEFTNLFDEFNQKYASGFSKAVEIGWESHYDHRSGTSYDIEEEVLQKFNENRLGHPHISIIYSHDYKHLPLSGQLSGDAQTDTYRFGWDTHNGQEFNWFLGSDGPSGTYHINNTEDLFKLADALAKAAVARGLLEIHSHWEPPDQ